MLLFGSEKVSLDRVPNNIFKQSGLVPHHHGNQIWLTPWGDPLKREGLMKPPCFSCTSNIKSLFMQQKSGRLICKEQNKGCYDLWHQMTATESIFFKL